MNSAGNISDAWVEPMDEVQYSEYLQGKIMAEEVTVFSSLFSPCGAYLVCGSGFGTLAIWKMSQYLEEDTWKGCNSPSITPHLRILPTNRESLKDGSNSGLPSGGAIYSLTFVGTGENTILAAGHELGVQCWRWFDLLDALHKMSEQNSEDRLIYLPPHFTLACPQTFGYLGSRGSMSEVNGVAPALSPNQLYGAAGDNNAYCWDLNTGSVVNTFSGHKGYLHCVAFASQHQALVTGAEDGMVGIWDCRSQNTVDFLKVKGAGLAADATLPGWVAALEIDEGGNWVVCGGGREKGSFLQFEGFLTNVHIGSRVLANNGIKTMANVQSVALWDNNILAAGSSRYLELYDRFCSSKRSHIMMNLPSAFSIGKSPTDEIFVVSGSSPSVDVFVHTNSRAFSLQFI